MANGRVIKWQATFGIAAGEVNTFRNLELKSMIKETRKKHGERLVLNQHSF